MLKQFNCGGETTTTAICPAISGATQYSSCFECSRLVDLSLLNLAHSSQLTCPCISAGQKHLSPASLVIKKHLSPAGLVLKKHLSPTGLVIKNRKVRPGPVPLNRKARPGPVLLFFEMPRACRARSSLKSGKIWAGPGPG